MAVCKVQKKSRKSNSQIQLKTGADKIKNEKSIPLLNELEEEVVQCYVGQDEAIRRIITAIYRSIYLKSIKTRLLIIGNNSTGKTEMLKQIIKGLGIPYTFENATNYMKDGYYGQEVEIMINKLIFAANYDMKKAQNGIIVIDQIDQIVGNHYPKISNEMFFHSLLRLINGDELIMTNGSTFDTSKIILIFCGTFSSVKEIKKEELQHFSIGFNTNTQHEQVEMSTHKSVKSDLIKCGLPKEFVVKIDTIVELKSLTKENFVEILKTSRLSIFRRYQNELEKLGIRLCFDEGLFEAIVDKSFEFSTDIIGLNSVVNYIFEDIIYNIMLHQGQYSKCEIDLDIIDDNKCYRLS